MRIPVEKIKEFYEFLKSKNIDEFYRLKQCSKKFNVPTIIVIWAINKEN